MLKFIEIKIRVDNQNGPLTLGVFLFRSPNYKKLQFRPLTLLFITMQSHECMLLTTSRHGPWSVTFHPCQQHSIGIMDSSSDAQLVILTLKTSLPFPTTETLLKKFQNKKSGDGFTITSRKMKASNHISSHCTNIIKKGQWLVDWKLGRNYRKWLQKLVIGYYIHCKILKITTVCLTCRWWKDVKFAKLGFSCHSISACKCSV